MSSQPSDQRRSSNQASLPQTGVTAHRPPSFPSSSPESPILTDSGSEGSPAENSRHSGKKRTEQSLYQGVTINALPDEVLLEIFDFCVGEDEEDEGEGDIIKKEIEAWQSLVHVCQQWRRIVFGSTNRLKLRLVCSSRTPARDTLDAWPSLPLLVQDNDPLPEGVDNIVAALECNDRVDRIELLNVGASPMERILAAMQVPFPELTELELSSNETMTVLPDSFLDGYAPRLYSLRLEHIPIPRLPSLLLRSTHLFRLHLEGIPHSGYFSPEELVTCLSTLRSLDNFALEFESPLSRPGRAIRRPPHSAGLFLYSLWFKGVSEYLDDLAARIDAPDLSQLNITFFNQIDFDIPRLVQFIGRTPKLKALGKASLVFGAKAAGVSLSSIPSPTIRHGEVHVEISCGELDWQVSSLEQLCTSFLPFTSTLEDLHIFPKQDSEPDWKDNVDNPLWLALLHPFTAVKDLYISKEFTALILPALQELVGGRTMEVLPTLQNIFLEELQPSVPVQEAIKIKEHQPSPIQEAIKTVVASEEPRPSVPLNPVQGAIETIVTARQLSGHPVTISPWKRDMEREEYPDPGIFD